MDKGYYDVAWQVGDVLLLTDRGSGDASPFEMIERCESIIEHYCEKWKLAVPNLARYDGSGEGRYDSVQVRDWYIDQLRPLF